MSASKFFKELWQGGINRQTLKFYWKVLLMDKANLFWSVITAALGFLTGNFLSYYFISLIIEVVSKHTKPIDLGLWKMFGYEIIMYIVMIFISNMILWKINAYIVWKQKSKLSNQLFYMCNEAILKKNMAFFKRNSPEEIISYTQNFVNAIVSIDKNFRGNFIPLISSLLFTAIILGPEMPLFTLTIVVFSLLFLLVAALTARSIYHKGRNSQHSENERYDRMFDVVENITIVKSHGTVKDELKKIDDDNKSIERQYPKFYSTYSLRDFSFSFIITLAGAILVCLIAVSNYWFKTDVGTIVLASAYMAIIMQQLWNITFLLKDLSDDFFAASEMSRILVSEQNHKRNPNKYPLEITAGEIKFTNINFQFHDLRYQLADTKMFKNFNLIIPGGQSVGIVGHSGAGKSTLIKFLMRFIEDYSGIITIDSNDIAKVFQYSLHQQIGYIGQNANLFNISVRDNLTYGKSDVSEKEIIAACKKANIWSFIEKLPDKINTVIGDEGVSLSAGQIQGIAIAREILKNPKIVILDEALSEVDADSARHLIVAIHNLIEGKTALVVGNDLALINSLERVIVLEKGKIVQDGTPEELTKVEGFYQKMFNFDTLAS